MERERIYLGDGLSIFRQFETWVLDWVGEGRRVRESLRTRDRGEAIIKAVEQSRALRSSSTLIPPVLCNSLARTDGESFREMVREAVRAELGQGVQRIKSIPVEQAIKDYLIYQKGTKGNTEAHVKNVGNQLRKFITFAKVEALEMVEPKTIANYLASCAENGQAAKTRKDKYMILGTFFRWAVEVAECLKNNPAEKVSPPKPARLDVEVYTADEARAILERLSRLEDPRPAAIFGGALYMGLRRGEFRYARVNLGSRIVRVANTEEKATKTKKSRTIPILDQALVHLNRLQRRADDFFGVGRDVGHLSKRIGAKLQTARHTYCTMLRVNGVAEFVACEWSGHTPEVFRENYNGYVLGMESLEMTYHNLGLVSHGLPEVPKAARSKAK